MQQQHAATSTDSECAELRALIEQQTKEFEAKNGPVKTLEIIRKEQTASYYMRSQSDAHAKRLADARSETNQKIKERYATAECLHKLAQELGLPSADSLTKRANRLGVQRGQINHPNVARAEQRMEKVGQLLDAGEPVKTIAKKLELPERSVRYYRQRLAAINKEVDAVENALNAIAARTRSAK